MEPILFSTPMVQAILAGWKTQTRRRFAFTMKPGHNPKFSGYSLGEYCTGVIESSAVLYARRGDGCWEQVTERAMPRYMPGDILWVRETWQYCQEMNGNDQPIEGTGKYVYAASPEDVPCYTHWVREDGAHVDFMPWRPSIHMPKVAARIFLRVTGVRAERVQSISEKDAIAEGIRPITKDGAVTKFFTMQDGMPIWPWHEGPRTAVEAYAKYWNELNAKRGFGWDTNPWVWMYEFERIEKPEEAPDHA